jgi:tryptophan 2,3-dioxygenase
MDVAHGEMVEKQLDAMIQRRARKGDDVDPDEREELWKASVRRYNARRREEMRAAWCEHHQEQAARLRAVLEALIARHEEQAERYRDQPETEGAA